MTVAVYGGTGFIGSAVVRRLLARGIAPLVLARGKHAVAVLNGATFVAADRDDGKRLVEIFQQHEVHTVIDIFALGLRNTAPMLEAMGAIGGRYVLLSSVDVYSNYAGLLKRESPPIQAAPAREDDPLRSFRYPYRQNDRRPQGVENDMLEDVGEAIALAATSPKAAGRTYNVGQGFVRTPIEWLLSFAVVLNQPIEVLEVPPEKRGLLADRADASDLRYPLTLDTTRIRTELGFREVVPERDALLATIKDEEKR